MSGAVVPPRPSEPTCSHSTMKPLRQNCSRPLAQLNVRPGAAVGRRPASTICGPSATWRPTPSPPTAAIWRGSASGWAGGSPPSSRSASCPTTWAGCRRRSSPRPASPGTSSPLKIFFRYLQLEGIVRDNPAELLGTQKTWQRVPEVLSPALVERLLAAPQRVRCLLAARPGAARAALCHRLPGVGSLEPEAGRSAPGRALLPGPRQREQGPADAAGRCGRRGDRRLSAARAAASWPRSASRRRPGCCFRGAASGCGARRSGSWSSATPGGPASAPTSARTRCGTALPRTCWPAAPTCGKCRSCSATPASPPRRSTRTSISRG